MVTIASIPDQHAFAVMASPVPIDVTQPDGSKIKIIKKGDERLNWTEDLDGHTVIKDPATGAWQYAVMDNGDNLVPSGVVVVPGKKAPKGTPLHLKPKARAGRGPKR